MHLGWRLAPQHHDRRGRWAVPLGAGIALIASLCALSSPQVAYAQEVSDTSSPGHAPYYDSGSPKPAWNGGLPIDPWDEELGAYVEDFGLPPAEQVIEVERPKDSEAWKDGHNEDRDGKTELRKRQGTQQLRDLPGNNSPGRSDISGGDIQRWMFSSIYVQGPAGEARSGLPGGFKDFEDQSVTHAKNEQQRLLREQDERVKTKRQSQKTVYIAINTCSQPQRTGNSADPDSIQQLTLFVSSTNAQLGSSNGVSGTVETRLVEGYAAVNITATEDVYIAVRAPSLTAGWAGEWSYSVAASIDDFYYSANVGLPPLYLVDTDSSSALLVTDNLTEVNPDSGVYRQWMDLESPPFTMFAQSNVTQSNIAGMRHSYCGLAESADLQASQTNAEDENAPIQMGMITRGLGEKPKQQFYIRGLNDSSSYQAILAMFGNSTAAGDGVVGGGGRVWAATNFTTKSDGNCALLFSLPFCSSIAYSVPSNPSTFPDASSLADFYDSYAAALYTNFTYSLQLIPCNTSSTSRYSLSKNCDDCAAAYKEWLCAVTIPRCEDFSSPLHYLHPRNVAQAFISNGSSLPESILSNRSVPMPQAPSLSDAHQQVTLGNSMASNSSRIARIDELVRPGPYRELLPCEDLCFDLVRSCPAALGFGCPLPGRGLEAGYGKRDHEGWGVKCSYAGAVYHMNAGRRIGVGSSRAAFAVGLMAAVLLYC